jgi:hypothetical protein
MGVLIGKVDVSTVPIAVRPQTPETVMRAILQREQDTLEFERITGMRVDRDTREIVR